MQQLVVAYHLVIGVSQLGHSKGWSLSFGGCLGT